MSVYDIKATRPTRQRRISPPQPSLKYVDDAAVLKAFNKKSRDKTNRWFTSKTGVVMWRSPLDFLQQMSIIQAALPIKVKVPKMEDEKGQLQELDTNFKSLVYEGHLYVNQISLFSHEVYEEIVLEVFQELPLLPRPWDDSDGALVSTPFLKDALGRVMIANTLYSPDKPAVLLFSDIMTAASTNQEL